MGGEKEIDGRDRIVGADPRNLLRRGEIAGVEEAVLAVSDEPAVRARVLSGIGFGLGLGSAVGVGLRLDAGNRADVLAIGSEHDGAYAGKVDGVAGMHLA